MKLKRFLLAAAFFLLPLFFRVLWFYRGQYYPSKNDTVPDFSEFNVIQPPLSTPPQSIVLSESTNANILFDLAHNNKYSLGEIESLRNLLLQNGAEINELKVKSDLKDMLNKSDAFVIITPTDVFSSDDLELIENFVQRGGRLMVITDPTRSYSEYDTEREKSVILANEIIKPFFLSFRNDYVYNLSKNEGNYRNVFIEPESSHPITNGVSNLVFYASHSIEAQSDILLRAEENSFSSLDDLEKKLPVACLDQSGNVFVIGDMTFLMTPYNQVADNFQFIKNIGEFLLTGSRIRTLEDFPALFIKPVAIRFASGIQINEELLAVIADLKLMLAKDDIPLVILENEQKGFDQIILGLFPPGKELEEYTDLFNIDFYVNGNIPKGTSTPGNEVVTPITPESSTVQDQSTFINIPGFGKIPSKGFGFLFLHQKIGQTSLILLADSQDNATNLLKLVVKGSLETCLSNEYIAVCQQDAVLKTIYLTETPTPEIEEQLTETPDPELAVTPTPTMTTSGPESTPMPTETPE